MNLSNEWAWAAGIIATPVAIFGIFEMMTWLRRRRLEATARRSKEPRRQPASRNHPGQGA